MSFSAFANILESMSHIITLAPDFKNLLAISKPNPCAPPVTKAVFFEKSKVIFFINYFFANK